MYNNTTVQNWVHHVPKCLKWYFCRIFDNMRNAMVVYVQEKMWSNCNTSGVITYNMKNIYWKQGRRNKLIGCIVLYIICSIDWYIYSCVQREPKAWMANMHDSLKSRQGTEYWKVLERVFRRWTRLARYQSVKFSYSTIWLYLHITSIIC